MKKLHILILCTGLPSKKLTNAILERGHSYTYYEPDELYLVVEENTNKLDMVYFKDGDKKPIKLKLNEFNAIITRLGACGEFGYTSLEHLTKNLGIYSVQSANGIRLASHKGHTTQLVSVAGLRTPKTVLYKNPEDVDFMIQQVGPFPIVLKKPRGSQGNGVHLMETYEQLKTTLELSKSEGITTLLQQYIEGGGTDYRVIVLDDKVLCTMKRTSADGFKANLSKKGKGESIKLSKEHEELCIKASKAIGLEFSGVDIMISNNDKRAYLIEINSNPGTKSIDICNHNWFVDWVELLEEKVLGGLVKSSSSRKVETSQIQNGISIGKSNDDILFERAEAKLENLFKIHGIG